jgi:TRAP-type C4-dicarboxylate transport system substrate-binding protein
MKTLTWLGGLVVSVTVVLGGATAVPTPVGAQAKPIVWNLPHVAAPTYYHILNYTAFANKVKDKSQGRMEIRVHPASSLYPSHELIPALVDGRAEIGPVVFEQPARFSASC